MHKDVGAMKEDMAAVKVDLAAHIRRTALLESELKFVHQHIMMVKGIGAFLGVLAVLAGIYRAFAV